MMKTFQDCWEIAKAVVDLYREIYSPNGIVDDARNGGDPPAPTTGESMNSILQAYTKNLPGLMQATSGQIMPSEQALFNAQKQLAPQQQGLNADLFSQYAPQYAKAQSDANLSNIQGSGGQAALAAQDLQKQIDPEYYKTRTATANGLQSLLSGPISGSESASIERANNAGQIRGGTFDMPSNATQLGAAMNFGSAGRDRLGQAIGLATQSLPTFKSGQDTFAQATGQGGTMGSIGTGQGLIGTNTGNNAMSFGNNVLGTTAGMQTNAMNINAQRRDSLDRVTGVLGSLPSD